MYGLLWADVYTWAFMGWRVGVLGYFLPPLQPYYPLFNPTTPLLQKGNHDDITKQHLAKAVAPWVAHHGSIRRELFLSKFGTELARANVIPDPGQA
jgi:hypothetical protein